MDSERIAEDKIREAMEKGEFDNLPGSGRPLQSLAAYFAAPENVRMGYSVLKSSGFIPEEVSLLKEIEAMKARLAACPNDPARKKFRLEIQRLQLKYDLILESYHRSRLVRRS